MLDPFLNLLAGAFPAQGTTSSTDTSDHDLIAAPETGKAIYITKVSISNNSVTDTEVVLKSGTTAIWTFAAPKNGGNEPVFPTVPIRCTSGDKLAFACSVAATTVTVSVAGFTARPPL